MSTAADDPALVPRLPDTLRLGPVHLTVSHLDGSIAFYERALGLQRHDRDGAVATLGTGGEDLLVLVEEADAAPGGRHDGDRVDMYTIALDMKDLMREVEGEEPRDQAGPGLVTGHLHLHVGDIERGLAFYRDVLGFEVMGLLPSAAFVSAGGYHHHLGFNTWLGSDVKPRPPNTAGLRHWTVLLASRDELAAVRARVDAAGLDAPS